MLRILIIGANSFIGKNLVDLLKNKHTIYKGVYKSMMTTSNSCRINIASMHSVKRAFKRINPDVVINCSQYGGFRSQTDLNKMYKVNIQGVQNVRDCLKPHQFGIHFGTSSEYGHKQKPMRETDLCNPIAHYGMTKLFGTMEALRNPNTMVLRPFSPFGNHEQPTRLIPYLMRCFEENKEIFLNEPEKTHDFFHVEYVGDVVNYIIDNRLGEFKNHKQRIYNIGSGIQHTVEDVVTALNNIYGQNRKFLCDPIKFCYTPWVAHTARTTKLVGHKYKLTLEQGLRKAVAWRYA